MKRFLAFLLTLTLTFTLPLSASAAYEEDWVYNYQPQPGDYSIAVIPDIQELTARYPDKLNTIMQWIVDNREKENIQFTVDVGDVTWSGHQNDANSIREFGVAAEAFSILEKAGMPYSVSYGNHDFVSNGYLRDTTLLNQYFPYEEYSSWETFGGCYEEGKMDNYYFTFEVNGIPNLILALEWSTMTPALKWGAQVVEDHPDHNVIVVTHGFLELGGERLKTYGDLLWRYIAGAYSNVFMVLCGHVENTEDPGSMIYRMDLGTNGNEVHQIMANAQDIDYLRGGVGLLLMLRFTNGGRTIDFNYFSPVHDGLAYKEVNQFSVTLPEEQVLNNRYTLRYDTAGGSTAPAKEILQPGESPAPVEAPTKENAEFIGWYNGDTPVDLTSFVMPAQSVTLTAKWEYAVTYGDVNDDGQINAVDALEVLKVAVDKSTFDEKQAIAGDVDANGVYNAVDALLILQKSVEKLEKFPCELV